MYCLDAYKNLYVEVRDQQVSISPCCVSSTHAVNDVHFERDPALALVRKQFDQSQWPGSCSYCKKIEDTGGHSRRLGSNRWYQDNGIHDTDVEFVRLDYWVGDLCNLACAICGPQFSSRWKQQLHLPAEKSRSVVNDFWKNLDLSKLRYVHFNGGEPLLSKEHVKFLEALPHKQSVTVSYNTNGTVRPTDHLRDLWLQFHLVELVFSVDDVGDRFEYQRWPAKWSEVVDNLQWYISQGNHNSMYAVNTTVSALNQYNLSVLQQWLQENFAQTKFTDPIEHRTQPAMGRFALDRSASDIRTQLDRIDSQRGTNWRTVFPELRDPDSP
jgi:molybdenum cofactor biosynthesis enzyme MoaA